MASFLPDNLAGLLKCSVWLSSLYMQMYDGKTLSKLLNRDPNYEHWDIISNKAGSKWPPFALPLTSDRSTSLCVHTHWAPLVLMTQMMKTYAALR